jgi:hypothetical protein
MTDTMRPEDVLADLANAAVTAWFNINDKNWGLEGLHRVMRICLAATMPSYEALVRAKVPAEILAERDNLPEASVDDRIFRTAMILASRVATVGPTRAPQVTGGAQNPEREHGEGSGDSEASQRRSEAQDGEA